MHFLVEQIFRTTKKAVKNQKLYIPIPNEEILNVPCEPVIKILTKYFNIDEIFLFHSKESEVENMCKSVLYILLISNKVSNQDLFEMMQIVSQQTEGRYEIVPIAHSRKWIQEHLTLYQPFFRKIMAPEKSIYTKHIPTTVHWHSETADLEVDDEIYYRLCTSLYENYKIFRAQENLSSNEGIGLLISGFFYRASSFLIYISQQYLPNEINIRILWKFCKYIHPKISGLDYLIDQLPFDFFESINPSKNLYHNFQCFKEENLKIMDELMKAFVNIIDEYYNNATNH